MGDLGLLIVGVFIIVIGITNMTGNISTIHGYNRRKVTEEDRPRYGKVMGFGTVVIGLGLVLAYFMTFWNQDYVQYILISSCVIGLCLIFYAQMKYNKGIF